MKARPMQISRGAGPKGPRKHEERNDPDDATCRPAAFISGRRAINPTLKGQLNQLRRASIRLARSSPTASRLVLNFVVGLTCMGLEPLTIARLALRFAPLSHISCALARFSAHQPPTTLISANPHPLIGIGVPPSRNCRHTHPSKRGIRIRVSAIARPCQCQAPPPVGPPPWKCQKPAPRPNPPLPAAAARRRQPGCQSRNET